MGRIERVSEEPKKRPTINDIAVLADVAPMTVSRVINGNGYVSAGLKARVLSAIARVDYRPNALARGLKHRRTRVVGILLPDIANPFCGELARGIQEMLQEKDYRAFLSIADPTSQFEESALQTFFDYQVDGVIVATRGVGSDNDAMLHFADRGYPIVVIGRNSIIGSDRPHTVDCVTADYRAGGRLVAKHLLSLGHRRIGFIGLMPGNRSRLLRFEGFEEELLAAGVEIPGELIVGAPIDVAYATQTDGYEGMKKLLSLASPPSAVFARNDFVALGALSAARDQGRSVPGDIAVVGFDDVPLAEHAYPSLTTVHQPVADQGREAALLLLDRIEGRRSGAGVERSFGCELVVRESSAARTAASRFSTTY